MRRDDSIEPLENGTHCMDPGWGRCSSGLEPDQGFQWNCNYWRNQAIGNVSSHVVCGHAEVDRPISVESKVPLPTSSRRFGSPVEINAFLPLPPPTSHHVDIGSSQRPDAPHQRQPESMGYHPKGKSRHQIWLSDWNLGQEPMQVTRWMPKSPIRQSDPFGGQAPIFASF